MFVLFNIYLHHIYPCDVANYVTPPFTLPSALKTLYAPEYDLNPKFITDCTDCSASDQLLIDSIQLLRNEANNDGTLDLYINSTVLENNNVVLTLNSFNLIQHI